MPKLTKRHVEAAQPSATQVLIWDTDVKGFGLRVTPAGAKAYILNYRNGAGQSRRYTIGKHGSPWTCEEARSKAVELLRGLAAGVDPLEVKAEARAVVTVADLVEAYLAEGPAAKPRKKQTSWLTDKSNLTRHVVPLLGHRPVKSITSSDIAGLQADIAAGRTKADVKTGKQGRAIVKGGAGIAARVIAIVGAMFEHAVKTGRVAANPARGVETAKGRKLERFLVDREVVALADALASMESERSISATMATAIRLLLLTGCRKSEILGLQWAWVDFDRAVLRLPDSKTGAKIVPLAAAALEVLSGLERTSPYVLPSSKTDGRILGLQKCWEKVRSRATAIARQRATDAGEPVDRAPNLDGVRLHDLRHSYASFAAAGGTSLLIIGRVLGHRQSRTTEIYAHLSDDPLKAAADRTGAKIADALKVGASRERLEIADIVPLSKARASRRS